jgi:hypothetical protein
MPPVTLTTPEPHPLAARARPAEVAAEKQFNALRFWAGIGAVVLAFEVYVLVKWVTGPYFTPVHPGASEQPTWMDWSLRSMEVAFVSLWLWCIWHYFVKPWREERRFTFDGLLCMALFAFAWFQDPLANYGGAVFTYNANLINVGSWLNEVPGVTAVGKPGAQLPEPLWTGAIYPGVIFLATILGCGFMRKVKQRFPGLGPVGLIATVFGFMFFFDVVLEGGILMPLGAYTYAGAPDWSSINDSHYYKYTLLEGVAFGAVWTAWASLRYFKDDKGNTIVERGIDRLSLTRAKSGLLRFLAIGGFIAVSQAVLVNVPYFWMSNHMSTYPADIQKRTYLTDGMCGEGTDTACFGPGVPTPRGSGSARVAPDGTLSVPKGTVLPKVVPIDRGPLGPEGD